MTEFGSKSKLQLKDDVANKLEGESIFEQLVELFPDIIHSVSDDGTLVSTNRKELELLGYTKEEIIGMPVDKIYDPILKDELKKGLDDLRQHGSLGIQSKLRTRSGDLIDVEIRSISLYDDKGNFAKTFSIIRDIRDLKNMQAQLVQSNKLASVGELATGILHDIKNPLTIIDSYSSMIEENLDKFVQEDIEKAAKSIQKATTRIKKILDHMRVYIRGEQEDFNPTCVKNIIEDAIFMLQSPIRNNSVNISVDVPETVYVLGIHNQLEQVFVNIIDNACDAMSKSKTREVKISTTLAGETVAITISDTGPGMPEEVTSQIFQSFYTTKAKGKGTGLGLSISNGIINEHKGTLEVASKVGEGTTFVITLPQG